MPPSQSHTPPTLNEALPPQPSIFVAASASKDPGAWRRGTRATTTFFPSSASEDGRILVRMAATRRRVSPPQRPPTFFLYSGALPPPRISNFLFLWQCMHGKSHHIYNSNTGSKQAQLFNGNIFVGTPLYRLLRFYFYKMQTEKNKLLGSPYACVAVQMQPAMECHNELR
uniref:Uncharacterized protein n=1 Tax=Oryza barthii TaxID=65489 RepID=A0A0D3GYH4_9ORYZ